MMCTCAPLAAAAETGTQTTTVASFGMAGLENSSLLCQLDGMGRQVTSGQLAQNILLRQGKSHKYGT